MSRAGQAIENKVTGERAVVVIGTNETGGQLGVYDLFVAVGGAVSGEHIHPRIEERFTVMRGMVGMRIDGNTLVAPLHKTITVPPGIAHDWWNAGNEEAHVRVEVRPAARFEQLIFNLFGLANDGKTNAKGMPNPLQLCVIGKEFQDTIVFTSPPPALQKVMFTVLAPIGQLLGYKGHDENYVMNH